MELAVLDACILFRGKLTDLLLCLAEQELFEPVWSDAIHAEWIRNVHARHGIPLEKLEYRRSEMERSFQAANCAAAPDVLEKINGMCRSDKQRKDAHVIASGVSAAATLIVTDNSPDFPEDILKHFGMRKAKPDAFCQDLFNQNQFLVIQAARAHRASMKRPPYSPDEYLDLLQSPKMELPNFSNLLRQYRQFL
ncbi:hypothetical protein J2847_002995 [Azospirillum agricola]|uniref:PIN domain-containing protein n=1 Tax=Azospirillum agricola TaxID=1720247 RepID=UPI001AE5179E|nr:PIN domain-containing protein [Azospirillum agricola]MBP2229696.1 hypothetical protein [Azospirillum agricola]